MAVTELKGVKEKWALVIVVPRVTMLLDHLVMLVILDHPVTVVMMELKVTWELQVSYVKSK